MLFRSSDSLDCYDWVVWSCWGLFCLLFSLRGTFYNAQSLCFECVVWPCRSVGSLIRTVMTSFVGHELCFHQFLVTFGLLLVLPKFYFLLLLRLVT